MSLRNKSIGIIGFNARPIACSAKRLGARVYVSDFWGDDDLRMCCDDWVAINEPVYDEIEDLQLSQKLVKNFIAKFSENDIDLIVVGSGFDDHHEALDELKKKWRILGNDNQAMKLARNPQILSRLAEENGIGYPRRIIATDKSSLIGACEKIGFPCIIRSMHSGGGSRIHLLLNLEQAIEVYEGRSRTRPVVIQEYIEGIDASCSIISIGEDARAISVQGQLIGIPSAGRNNDFIYCGNYWPLEISQNTQNRMMEVSESICKSIGLIGSNGIDYVIRDDEIFLLEINPRIQGTLEMLELSGQMSILEMHLNACNGRLPSQELTLRPVVKMIVYAKHDGICPDLSKFPNTFDLTPTGVLIEKRSPICTVIVVDRGLDVAYEKARRITARIQEACRFKDS